MLGGGPRRARRGYCLATPMNLVRMAVLASGVLAWLLRPRRRYA
jgi:hypothetical protein